MNIIVRAYTAPVCAPVCAIAIGSVIARARAAGAA